MTEFYLNKDLRKIKIASYIGAIVFFTIYMFIIKNDQYHKYMSIFYIFYFILIIFIEYKNYNNVLLNIKNNKLNIKWRSSLKKKQIDINNINEINLTKDKLRIKNNSATTLQYTISDFQNEQRKNLLNFFKSNFNNVTIN